MRRMEMDELARKDRDELINGDTIAIEQAGRVVGYFVPVNWRDPERVRRAYEAFDRAVDAARTEGTTAEDVIEMLAGEKLPTSKV